jgi:hypothetical protein
VGPKTYYHRLASDALAIIYNIYNREVAQQPYEPSDGFCAVRNWMANGSYGSDGTLHFHSSMMYTAVNIHISFYNDLSCVPPLNSIKNSRNPEVWAKIEPPQWSKMLGASDATSICSLGS